MLYMPVGLAIRLPVIFKASWAVPRAPFRKLRDFSDTGDDDSLTEAEAGKRRFLFFCTPKACKVRKECMRLDNISSIQNTLRKLLQKLTNGTVGQRRAYRGRYSAWKQFLDGSLLPGVAGTHMIPAQNTVPPLTRIGCREICQHSVSDGPPQNVFSAFRVIFLILFSS